MGDLHFGARSDHPIILAHQIRFLEEVFFPELESRKVDAVIQLGDIVDRRKFINFHTAHMMRRHFLRPLAKYPTHVCLGNHDAYYKTNNEINAYNELFGEFANLTWYTKAITVNVEDKIPVLFLPWIPLDQSYTDLAIKEIENSPAKIVIGHIEIQGFEQNVGHFCEEGFDPNIFGRFDKVLLGHFHKKSSSRNIHYLGTPFALSWNDYGQTKGFYILDTDTMEMEFIPNPYNYFHKLEYNAPSIEDINTIDFSNLQDAFVKLVVQNKPDPYLYDLYLAKLETSGYAEIQIYDSEYDITLEVNDDVIEADDTLSLLEGYCSQVMIDETDRDHLIGLMHRLYVEAEAVS